MLRMEARPHTWKHFLQPIELTPWPYAQYNIGRVQYKVQYMAYPTVARTYSWSLTASQDHSWWGSGMQGIEPICIWFDPLIKSIDPCQDEIWTVKCKASILPLYCLFNLTVQCFIENIPKQSFQLIYSISIRINIAVVSFPLIIHMRHTSSILHMNQEQWKNRSEALPQLRYENILEAQQQMNKDVAHIHTGILCKERWNNTICCNLVGTGR